MGKKKTSEPRNDFAGKEDLDVCSFSEDPIITGKCIASFSFNDDPISENNETAANLLTNNIANTSTPSSTPAQTFINNENILTDNRTSPIVNGCAPPINGESLDVKRTYILRGSTVRKLNELKSIHPDLNTYVSTLVDLAIAHYYEHIINNSNTQ